MLSFCGVEIEVDDSLGSTRWQWIEEWLEPIIFPPEAGDFCKFWDSDEEPDDGGVVHFGFLHGFKENEAYPYDMAGGSIYAHARKYSTGGAK